jgi:hypothetical protein
MRKWIFQGVIAAVVGGIATSQLASAAVIGGAVSSPVDGTFSLIGPPAAVGNDEFNVADTLFAFDELQDVVLSAPLTVNEGSATFGTEIPAGTVIDSHYVFIDPPSTQRIQGTVDFDGEVIGVIKSKSLLEDSDYLGAPATSYSSVGLRGLERRDSVSISATQQVAVDVSAGSPGDFVRVITLVPEPATAGMLAAGALFVLGRRRS